jgi:hypothetical protein
MLGQAFKIMVRIQIITKAMVRTYKQNKKIKNHLIHWDQGSIKIIAK